MAKLTKSQEDMWEHLRTFALAIIHMADNPSTENDARLKRALDALAQHLTK